MEDVNTNSELTVEKIAEVALPKDAMQMQRFVDSEMPVNPAEFAPLREFFGIQDLNKKSQDQLLNVWEFFANDPKEEGKKLENPGEVLKRIKAALSNLMSPSIGDTRLNQLNNYITIIKNIEDAKKMKEAYEQ
jgi:hypothetical protein